MKEKPAEALLAVRAREATGLTQVEFAALVGANRVTVANWESGERPPSTLTASLLRLIAAHPRLAVKTLRSAQDRVEAKLDALSAKVRRTGRKAENVGRLTDREVASSHRRGSARGRAS